MKIFHQLSLVTLALCCSILSIYRLNVVRENEISWDVLGYYLYLPATFIHDDPMLNDISWLKKVNEEKKLAGSLYMVSENEERQPMYFFLMGMALFYLPFFLAGNAYASMFGYPVDGFSIPYQYALSIGGVIYTVIGLIYLRKILLRFFSEGIASLVMLIVVFGTNYINHLTIDDLGTVNVLFMLTTIVIWNTIQWHENYKARHLIVVCIAITLAALVKPTEVFVLLIPLLWNVDSWESLKVKWRQLMSQWKYIFIAALLCLLIVLPQMIYWYEKTGRLIYDSYKNPGVGLDFRSPHIMEVLFSYRKGWLLYTPIMGFSLIGFYFLYKQNKKMFYALIVYFTISLFIISSWSEWWYGAGFSTRPMIATYPVLAICLGYFLMQIARARTVVKFIFGMVAIFFVFLNQFQWWQYKNYILDPYRTTKEYYWATFLKTDVTDKDKESLLVYRDFTGKMELVEEYKYQKTFLILEDFEESSSRGNEEEEGNSFHHMTEDQEFLPILETSYNELTRKDHVWLRVSMDIRFPPGFEGSLPCIVNTMERENGSYGYTSQEIGGDSLSTEWRRVEVMYITPEIRDVKDRLKCYIWKKDKSTVDVDNIKVELFKRKL